ncbi:MAG: hypothetical protein LUE29_08110 [Lachnospiraceae bacterium]|nr:hypothetical protein [Lachnospiraceae bacterium]
MKNKEIRKQIEQAGLRYWQVAEAIGIYPSTFCIWLRQELTGSRLERVQKAIEELTGGDGSERSEA